MFRKLIYIQVVLVAMALCLISTDAAAQTIEATLCGTWSNAEYAQGTQKLILSADGSYVGYTKADPTKACMRGNCKVVERWSDSAGNRWFRSIFLSENGEKSFCRFWTRRILSVAQLPGQMLFREAG